MGGVRLMAVLWRIILLRLSQGDVAGSCHPLLRRVARGLSHELMGRWRRVGAAVVRHVAVLIRIR